MDCYSLISWLVFGSHRSQLWIPTWHINVFQLNQMQLSLKTNPKSKKKVIYLLEQPSHINLLEAKN